MIAEEDFQKPKDPNRKNRPLEKKSSSHHPPTSYTHAVSCGEKLLQEQEGDG